MSKFGKFFIIALCCFSVNTFADDWDVGYAAPVVLTTVILRSLLKVCRLPLLLVFVQFLQTVGPGCEFALGVFNLVEFMPSFCCLG